MKYILDVMIDVTNFQSIQTAVQSQEMREKELSTKQRTKFDPMDWMDSVNDQPETPKPSRCFYVKDLDVFYSNYLSEQSTPKQNARFNFAFHVWGGCSTVKRLNFLEQMSKDRSFFLLNVGGRKKKLYV